MAAFLGREEYAANEILRDHIYKRYENRAFPQEWRNLSELPSKSEICHPNQKSTGMADTNQEGNLTMSQMNPVYDQNLPHNIVDGPWPSREAYLGAHYQILREDSIAPLRRAVSEFKKCPALVDDVDTCVYKDVRNLAMANGFILTRTGNDQGSCVRQDRCCLASGILPSEANQVEALKAIVARISSRPEQ